MVSMPSTISSHSSGIATRSARPRRMAAVDPTARPCSSPERSRPRNPLQVSSRGEGSAAPSFVRYALRRLTEATRVCICNEWARMHLQDQFPDHKVDVEYNRAGEIAKRVPLSQQCAKRWNRDGEALAVPDVIVHRRGDAGPNVLVLE